MSITLEKYAVLLFLPMYGEMNSFIIKEYTLLINYSNTYLPEGKESTVLFIYFLLSKGFKTS